MSFVHETIMRNHYRITKYKFQPNVIAMHLIAVVIIFLNESLFDSYMRCHKDVACVRVAV